MILIDVAKCRPSACDGELCQARGECPTKAIWQPEPGEVPFLDVGRCTACGKCLTACPLRAIRKV